VSGPGVPRVVLDTNCLVSALIFSRGRFAWLRQAWQTRRFVALASRDAVGELLRVFAYPKFKLTAKEQQALLADFPPYAETVKIDRHPPGLSLLRDPDDIIFTALAAASHADALVSGDGDLQAVRDPFHVPILTIAEFADWLQAH
jgi:putative PIN family toxin of toxin-antitoxin system